MKVKLYNKVTAINLPYHVPVGTVLKVVEEKEDKYKVDDGTTFFWVHKNDVRKYIKGN